MANEQSGLKFFLIFTIALNLVFCCGASAKEDESESPLLDIAQTLLRESVRNQNGGSGLSVLSGLVQGFMQTEGGKQIGDMLAGNQKGNAGAAELISGLASMWQASKAGSSGTAGTGRKDDSSFDPAIIGTMIDLFSTISKAASDSENQAPDRTESKVTQLNKDEGSVDWEAMLNLAGSVISTMSGNQGTSGSSNSGFESLLSFLPVLLNSMSGQHNIHATNSIPHHSHEQFLPPILENLHEYWDHFIKSEFGKNLWENSGLSDLMKIFTNSRGEFEVEKIFSSLENNSFRRMWVKSISSFVAQWVKHFTDPEVQKRYLDTVELVCNSFLKAQGYPKNTLIDLKRPAESISALTNAVFKKQFNLQVNSANYVQPLVLYIQEIFKMGQKKGFGVSKLSTQDIQNKLAETLDVEIIEPVLRVNRAYKFISNRKECARYVICAINQQQEVNKSSLKPGITKLSSMGVSWLLSGKLNVPFWDLYNAVVEENGCEKYDKLCSEFNSEDLRATTEYFHNEL